MFRNLCRNPLQMSDVYIELLNRNFGPYLYLSKPCNENFVVGRLRIKRALLAMTCTVHSS